MKKELNSPRLSIKIDDALNVTQASLLGILPFTAAYVYLGELERFSIGNSSLENLRAKGTAKKVILRGLEIAGYHPCNLPELVTSLYEKRNDSVGFSWEPLNERNENAQDGTIEFISRQEKSKKLIKGMVSTSSIFSLSAKELNRLPLPKDFKYFDGENQYFIHHCRPDEQRLDNWSLYTNSNSDDRPHLHWDTFFEYFENVNKVPQLARAVYRSVPLEQWLEKPVDFATIHLPKKPSKMTPLLATAVFGGEGILDKLQETLEISHYKFLEDLLNQAINLPMESEGQREGRAYQLGLELQSDGKLSIYATKNEDEGISSSCYNSCNQLFSNKGLNLPKIELPSYSKILTEKDQLYFRSLFGTHGFEAICKVLDSYGKSS